MLGEDPQADKHDRRDRDRVTLKSCVAEFLLHKKAQVRPKTFMDLNRYLSGPYFAGLHGLPIDQVTRRDVASVLVTVTRQRSAITAGLARTALQGFYVWAMQIGAGRIQSCRWHRSAGHGQALPMSGTAVPTTGLDSTSPICMAHT